MAVDHAIEELTELSRKILMHFNTSTVLITADHGFYFNKASWKQQIGRRLHEAYTCIQEQKALCVRLGLPETSEAWKGSTKATAGTVSDTDFGYPKG